MAPFILSLHRSVVLVPVQKNSPKHDVPPPCFTVGMVFLDATQHSFSSKHDKLKFVPKSSILVSSDLWHSPNPLWIIQMLSSKLQTGLDMYWLKQGDTSGTAGFESLVAQCVLMVSLCYFVPSLSVGHSLGPPCGSGIFAHSSCDNFDPHRVRSCMEPQIEGDYQWFYMSSIFNNCSHSWFLHTSCLPIADSVFPSLVAGLQFCFWCPLTALWSWP